MKTHRKSKRTGSALALVICAMLVLLVLGVGYLSLGMNSRIFVIRDASTVVARSAADAGLARLVYELNEELSRVQTVEAATWSTPAGLTDPTPVENCNATYIYPTATFKSGTNPSAGFYVSATGKSNGAVCNINGTVKLRTIWDYALWVRTNMILKNGATIGWINPDADDLLRGFKVGTDSTEEGAITLNKNTTINADILVGVGGEPASVLQGQGEGEAISHSYAAMEEYVWDPYPVLAPSSTEFAISQGIIDTERTITASGQYSGINMDNNDILTVDLVAAGAPVTLYINGDVRLKNHAQLQIIAPPYNTALQDPPILTIYVAGSFIADNSGGINTTPPVGWTVPDSRMLQIYGITSPTPGCTSIDLRVDGSFYGAIYAPNADVLTRNSFPFIGAIAAKSFEQKNGATFYYDANLRNLSAYERGVYFKVENWQENNSWQF